MYTIYCQTIDAKTSRHEMRTIVLLIYFTGSALIKSEEESVRYITDYMVDVADNKPRPSYHHRRAHFHRRSLHRHPSRHQ